jgi:hypothetical protein
MRRLLLLAAIAAGAGALRMALNRERPVAASGNGHSADEGRLSALRERIAAARSRLQGGDVPPVRGE